MRRHRRRRALVLAASLLLVGTLAWLTTAHVRQGRLDDALVAAVNAADTKRAADLLQAGADPNARPVVPATSRWLRVRDAVLGRRPATGEGALERAARRREWAVMEALVRRGADPNVGTTYQTTPLYRAVADGPPSLVGLLLQHGARTRLDLPEGALCAAADRPDPASRAVVAKLLLEHGADPSDAATALVRSVEMGDLPLTETLLRGGTHPDAGSGGTSVTALERAASLNNEAAVRLLLRWGADPTRRVAGARPGQALAMADLARTAALRHLLRQAEVDWRRKRAQPPATGAASVPARP